MEERREEPLERGDSDVITLALAEDHAIVRSGLRMLLEAQPGFRVVAEAGDVASTRRALLGHRPDVLVLDLNLRGERSLPAIPSFLEASPGTAIVVLTMQDEPAFAREALQAGARGYLLKEAAEGELVRAVRLAAEGRTYLQPELGAQLAAEPPRQERPGDLTPRELDVLRLIALGHTNAEIGSILYLSVRTVEAHRANILAKLGLSTRAQLVRYALEHRLIGVPATAG
jgi:two-component system response regulator NreC